MRTVPMFGLSIAALSFDQALAVLEDCLRGQGCGRVVVTPNVDHVVRLHQDPALAALYQSADLILADGFPLLLASRLLHGREGLPERVTGADLFPALCRRVAASRGRIFLLGGHPGQDQAIRQALAHRYPGAEFEVFSPPFGFDSASPESAVVIERLNRFQPDLTFVCLGMPRQELWALAHCRELRTKLICCFGAAFEFDLGLRRRAPRLVRSLGLEWLWRLAADPVRLGRRYLLNDPYFLVLLMQELGRRNHAAGH